MRKRCVGSCSWREYCSAISLCVAIVALTLQVGGCMCLSVCLSVCAHERRVIAKGEMSPHIDSVHTSVRKRMQEQACMLYIGCLSTHPVSVLGSSVWCVAGQCREVKQQLS